MREFNPLNGSTFGVFSCSQEGFWKHLSAVTFKRKECGLKCDPIR